MVYVLLLREYGMARMRLLQVWSRTLHETLVCLFEEQGYSKRCLFLLLLSLLLVLCIYIFIGFRLNTHRSLLCFDGGTPITAASGDA